MGVLAPLGRQEAAFRQLYSLETFTSGTLVALTGVLDDRLLVSFGDGCMRRFQLLRLPPRSKL